MRPNPCDSGTRYVVRSARVLVLVLGVPCFLGGLSASLASEGWEQGRLRMKDRGSGGVWTIDAPVTVSWRQEALRGRQVVIELTRNRRHGWSEIGRAEAESESFTWTVAGEPGRAFVRVRVDDGRAPVRPRRITLAPPVREISFGTTFGIALHEDGVIRVWGQIGQGYLSLVHHSSFFPEPTVLPEVSSIASVSAGGTYAMAIKSDGTTWILGPFYPGPVNFELRPIRGAEGATWVRAGYMGAYFGMEDGRVFGWTGRQDGVFRDSEGIPWDVALDAPSLSGVIDVAQGDDHALALRADGSVVSWGSNFLGQLGDELTGYRSAPGPVPGLNDVVAIAARSDTSLALLRDGTVWIWGIADYLNSPAIDTTYATRPTRVEGLDDVVAIGCGWRSAYALRADGSMFAWGSNTAGQIGDGTTTDRTSPVECIQHGIRRFYVGDGAVHVITTTNERLAWGGGMGLGQGIDEVHPTPIAIHSR